ncbi:MAG: chemotaxis protein CheW [Gemmatimonadota bacterium]|nr:MAG: chemotaxis protein CheW [Gemmatimonadota bacterium]
MAGVRVLVFRVADRLCGADVRAVREILPRQVATRVPGADGAVAGLINVRGRLVPLVEGSRALGHSTDGGARTIVLLEVREQMVGFTVDEVIDLVSVADDDLSDRDDLPGVDPRLVRAVARRGDDTFVLLDLEALLTPILSV